MGMRVGMAVFMRVGMFMMRVVGVIMVVLMGVIMPLMAYGSPYPVVVVMDISLMVIVVVNDQGTRRTLFVVMVVMGVMSMMMVVLMTMFMVMFMFVMMLMIVHMAGDPRLAASAYATHINLPRCR
ncbi:hypothetical protein MF133_00405 [Aeromonas caviae]|uniref:hypothetical protein n=1 Tax=Aeromonas caviae TaxID=648 RepID=UPI001EF16097|nr:hypothetical protein [Aeromonas caviae]ULH04865.1 hypothetical protein MF133_00405 [Aeromonas caviae]WDV30314.1 hypothetical protein PVK35_12880 [Aeromonas caviae]